jgi:hypothetical protein
MTKSVYCTWYMLNIITCFAPPPPPPPAPHLAHTPRRLYLAYEKDRKWCVIGLQEKAPRVRGDSATCSALQAGKGRSPENGRLAAKEIGGGDGQILAWRPGPFAPGRWPSGEAAIGGAGSNSLKNPRVFLVFFQLAAVGIFGAV